MTMTEPSVGHTPDCTVPTSQCIKPDQPHGSLHCCPCEKMTQIALGASYVCFGIYLFNPLYLLVLYLVLMKEAKNRQPLASLLFQRTAVQVVVPAGTPCSRFCCCGAVVPGLRSSYCTYICRCSCCTLLVVVLAASSVLLYCRKLFSDAASWWVGIGPKGNLGFWQTQPSSSYATPHFHITDRSRHPRMRCATFVYSEPRTS